MIRIHSHPGATPLAGATQWSETRSPGPTKFPKASTGPVEDHVDHETQTPEAPPEVRIQQIKNRVASRSFSIPCCMQQAPCKVLGILGDPMVVTHILNPMRSEKSVQCNPMSPGTPPPLPTLCPSRLLVGASPQRSPRPPRRRSPHTICPRGSIGHVRCSRSSLVFRQNPFEPIQTSHVDLQTGRFIFGSKPDLVPCLKRGNIGSKLPSLVSDPAPIPWTSADRRTGGRRPPRLAPLERLRTPRERSARLRKSMLQRSPGTARHRLKTSNPSIHQHRLYQQVLVM